MILTNNCERGNQRRLFEGKDTSDLLDRRTDIRRSDRFFKLWKPPGVSPSAKRVPSGRQSAVLLGTRLNDEMPKKSIQSF